MVSLATALDRYRPSRSTLAVWAAREPDLAGLAYDELRHDQLNPAVPLAVKDGRLRGLIRLARIDANALTALLACLLRMLGALARRYRRSLAATPGRPSSRRSAQSSAVIRWLGGRRGWPATSAGPRTRACAQSASGRTPGPLARPASMHPSRNPTPRPTST